MNIPEILKRIRPGAKWNLRGDGYDGLEWMDDAQPKPSMADLQAVSDAVDVTVAAVLGRRQEYPPFGDQLDAIWSALAALPGLPDDTKAMLSRIQAVKAKFPTGL